jgi:serine/threonine protein kinase
MPRAPKEPPRIPGYEILEGIGSGGQGAVWRARQLSLDRIIALKVLWPEDASDPVLARRFIQEARIASKLNHPNIIQVIDVGETEGTYWYAMEFVAGVTALELFRERGPLPEGEVLEIAWQVAQALQHGTDRGLIHGDLKPENVLITPEGVAKVVDFGLARLSSKRGWHMGKSNDEYVQGTEGFVAPEILENKSTGDARSDLFALGVTIYELLTTTLPPSPKRGSQLGPDVRERRPNTTRRTAELVMALLAPDPAKRPESAAKVLEELGRRSSITLPATVSPIAPVKPPQSNRLRRTDPDPTGAKKKKIAVLASGAAALILAIWAGAKALSKPEPGTPEPPRVVESRPHQPESRKTEAAPVRATTPRDDASRPAPAPVTRPEGRRLWPPPPVETETRATEPQPMPTPPPDESRPAAPPPVREPDPEPQARPEERPPASAGGAESRAPAYVSVATASAGVRVLPPPPGIPGAAWTVLVAAGDACDLTVRPPPDFESKDTGAEVAPEGRARGMTVKSSEAGHVAAFRSDRSAQWGPREFTITFRRGAASSKLRLRVQVGRPANLLALAPAPALKDALGWLERHQSADGAISAASFFVQCTGDQKCDGVGPSSSDAGVTALAVLAALRAGESAEWVREALAYLVSIQRSDGRFASADDGPGTYAHLIATEATALGWHLLGGADVRAAAQRGVEAVEAARNLQAAGGAWRYGVQSGDNDTSVTIWAMRALLAAKLAGLKVSDSAIDGGASWIRRLTETNTNEPGFGRVGYQAPGSLPIRAKGRELEFPPQLSESLTAGALSVALACGDRKPSEKIAEKGHELVLQCRPYWDGSTAEGAKSIRERLNNPTADLTVISSRDFYYWQLATSLFRTWRLVHGRPVPEGKKWNLAKVLGPAQKKDGCAAGSFDPDDPWGPELGRAGATAMLALALANEQYQQPLLDEVAQ